MPRKTRHSSTVRPAVQNMTRQAEKDRRRKRMASKSAHRAAKS